MTIALCFNCGETKWGALCPCEKCGCKGTGNIELDIVFSDHHISARSLEDLGKLIKRLHAADTSGQEGVCFWAFIAYISQHPSELLKANPPAEIAADVDRLLTQASLPQIEIEMAERRFSGPPANAIPLPSRLFRIYIESFPFEVIARVEVRVRDGGVIRADLVNNGGEGMLLVDESRKFDAKDILALRRRKSGLLGWLFPERWVLAG
ncbi:hypothetical protein LOC68_22810 [Blastopirellula sp. JC732]|uniref:Uncharacterized protein n=1 Tax=Blastopirellula sediminis TaxID=2894196 RepID=A0A9X1MTD1_9BACT|nr:hypothetical protein [Blastopirellula sediminis]MCC9605466.1 hypothetical protein [Blastopirellula sediminis]MCC9631234.1 hypothetical protein [Blastopirellula sediminis]